MTKKKYIEKLERELKYEVSGKMMLKEHISELEKKIQRLEGELTVAQVELAILKEEYIGRAESHHGEWIKPYELLRPFCSVCKAVCKDDENTKYCHNCGAIMDNGDEERE